MVSKQSISSESEANFEILNLGQTSPFSPLQLCLEVFVPTTEINEDKLQGQSEEVTLPQANLANNEFN